MQQNDQMDPRTAAAVQKAVEQLNETWTSGLEKLKQDIVLRKWCIEAACKLPSTDVVATANQMHAFLLEAFNKT